jgi:DNA polymerase III sliding clamp (beta) subunit (PCNA family)
MLNSTLSGECGVKTEIGPEARRLLQTMTADQQADKDTVNVTIPASLARRIEKILAGSDFKTVDAYIEYVLNQLVTELEGGRQKSKEAFSEKEQETVEDRLRNLGYM